MIYLVLLKRDMLRYVQDMRAVRGMVRDLSANFIVLCKVKLVGTWREVVVGARRIRSEKLRVMRSFVEVPESNSLKVNVYQ